MSHALPNTDLNTLRAFAAVAECGGFTAASLRLGCTQASVSKSIGRLEDLLQISLFKRTTRRVELTPDGTLFLQRVQKALNELDTSLSLLHETPGTLSGVLKIAAHASFARSHLVGPLTAFLHQNPHVKMELTFCQGHEDMLPLGNDLCIGHPKAAKESYTARLLCTWRYLLVASPAYLARRGVPRTPAELVQHQCISPKTEQGQIDAWEFVPANDDSRRTNHRLRQPSFIHQPGGQLVIAGQYEGGIEAALGGLGIGVAAFPLIKHQLEAGELKVVLPEWRLRNESDLLMLYRPQEYLPLRLRAVMDHLDAAVRADPLLQVQSADLLPFAA